MKRQSNSELRILLIRLREIGDVVFTTPAVRALRKHYPDAHISYIVEPHAAPVVRDNPHINDVIVAPRVRVSSTWCFLVSGPITRGAPIKGCG